MTDDEIGVQRSDLLRRIALLEEEETRRQQVELLRRMAQSRSQLAGVAEVLLAAGPSHAENAGTIVHQTSLILGVAEHVMRGEWERNRDKRTPDD